MSLCRHAHRAPWPSFLGFQRELSRSPRNRRFRWPGWAGEKSVPAQRTEPRPATSPTQYLAPIRASKRAKNASPRPKRAMPGEWRSDARSECPARGYVPTSPPKVVMQRLEQIPNPHPVLLRARAVVIRQVLPDKRCRGRLRLCGSLVRFWPSGRHLSHGSSSGRDHFKRTVPRRSSRTNLEGG